MYFRNSKKKKKGAPGSGVGDKEKEKDKKGQPGGKAEGKGSQDRIKSQDGKQPRGHEDSDHKLDKTKSTADRPDSHMTTGERTDSAEEKG